MKKLSIAAIIMASLAIAGEIFIFATQKEDSEEIQKKAIMNDYRVYAPVIPDTMTFAGERVPLDIYYVREALDNELIINMYRQSSTVLYFKRANRFFPVIEPILQRNGIPDDFKYLCVIESGLTNATSPAKAQGYWQFLASTGTTYGLLVNDEIDMRNDLEASTEAACKYLRNMYDRFHSWTAAAAAYNCGENGLGRRMDAQGITSYYDTRLNSETGRYVYRILAMKDNGTTYKMLRDLNPWLQTDKLKNKANKKYTVKLPVDSGTKHKTLTQGRKNTRFITSI